MTENNMHISERVFGPVRLVHKSAVISERILTEPARLSRREATIGERSLSGPLHIFGHSFAPVAFAVSDVSFAVGRNYIDTIFTTSESATCIIWGTLYPVNPELIFDIWYSNPLPHGTAHTHRKTALASSTEYAIRIYATDGMGNLAYMPSSEGYYVVETTNSEGIGGGAKEQKTIH